MNTIVKSVRPLLADADYASNIQLLQKYTDYLDVTGDLTIEIARFLRYKRNLAQGDFVTDTAKTLTSIDSKYNVIDNQFLLPYIKLYNSSVSDIKELVVKQSGKNSIYGDISDCIGLLGNSAFKLTDTVIPFNDINSSFYGIPVVYPAGLSTKVRSNTQAISEELSRKTSSMFRQNIINIQIKYATTTESHGSNLITDIDEYFRSAEYSFSITKQLEKDFGNLFKIITFFNTINNNVGYNPGDYNKNLQEILPTNFKIIYGNEKINVDLLGKKITDARSKITIAKSLASPNGDVFIKPTAASVDAKYLESTVDNPKTGTIIPTNTTAKPTDGQATNNKAPAPVSKAEEEKKAAKQTYKQQEEKEKKQINIKVTEIPGKLLSLPGKAVKFSTQLFASATKSPLAAAQQIRNLICKGIDFIKTFDLNIINNITWPPKLPTGFKTFSFKKLVMKLVFDVRARILKEIYKRIFGPLEAFYQKVLSIKKRILDTIDQIKGLFSCNKD